MNYSEIKEALSDAEQSRNKIAMFHFITLKHADDFIDEDPKAFCKAVGMQESYAAEFLKMRALYLLMKEKNLSL
ncbi:MAG: hypothetical protein H6860_02075 [Rhodospirillales bacterium]|nr:hypothetical protein [Rhodospirillales bacterium]